MCFSSKKIFTAEKITIIDIVLGEITVEQELKIETNNRVRQKLSDQGFELLDDKQAQIINQIKSIIINEIHYKDELSNVNLSTILSENLGYDYSYLSRLFSSIESKTIEKYVIQQKIEKIKEYITYDELTLSEIAFKMGYSSTAHLSSQFKKITGIPPSSFKKMVLKNRKMLDDI